MWGKMIPYPHQSCLGCHVSNGNTYRGCALGSNGIHNVPLDCSCRAEGEVVVSDQSAATTSS